MPKTARLLKFLINEKIPIREAIDFLKLAERMIIAKKLLKGGRDEDMVQDRK